MIKIYHNNRCSKSRCALTYLRENNFEFEILSYLDNPLSKIELIDLLGKLKLAAIDIVRKNEKLWKENYKNKDLTEAEILDILVGNPILIERPIVSNKEKAAIARPLENIFEVINQ